MAAVDSFTDAELEQALEQTQGQPTKAAELLGVTYMTVWRRIKRNPALNDVKIAHRGKTFQDMHNLATVMAMGGIIREPKTNEETGEVIDGEFVNKKVDYRTRQTMLLSLMNTFKGDEGIKDTIVVENSGINLAKMSDAGLEELMKAVSDDEEDEIEEVLDDENQENDENVSD